MRIFLVVIFIACMFGNVYGLKASQLDSLVNQLNLEMSDKDRINVIWEIVKKTYQTDPDKGRYYASKLKKLADGNNDDLAKARAIWITALIDDKESKLVQALKGYFESLYLYKNIQNITGITAALNNIASIYEIGNENKIALEFFLEALPYYIQLDNKKKLTKIYYNLSKCSKNLGETKNAREYLNKAIELSKANNLTRLYAKSLNMEGSIYFKEENYSEARKSYQKYLEYSQNNHTEEKNIAIAYNNIGETYMEEGNLDIALGYLNKSLSIREQLGPKEKMAYTLNVLGSLMLKKGNEKEAFLHFQKAVSFLDGKSINRNLFIGLKNIHMILVLHNKTEMKVEYGGKLLDQVEMLHELKKELEAQNTRYMIRMATLMAELDHEKRLHEAKVKEYTRIGSIAGSVFLLFILVLYIGNKRKKKILKKEAAVYNAEKDDLEEYERMNGFD